MRETEICAHRSDSTSVRYRYYISFDRDGRASTRKAERIAAGDLEPQVLAALRKLLMDRSALVGLLTEENCNADSADAMLSDAQALVGVIDSGSPSDQRHLLEELNLKLTVDGDTLRADFELGKLANLLGVEPIAIEASQALAIPARPRRRGREIRLLVEGKDEVPNQRDGRLVMLLLKAQAARQQLHAANHSPTTVKAYTKLH